MKTQKGITLIALIITVIVMLILVGVSVSVALNTGLFKSAQGAAKNTEAERVNETKLSEGWITIINSTTGKTEEVDINSFGASDEGGTTISLSDNPTHILKYSGVKWEIDETTTFEEFFEKSILELGWYEDGTLVRRSDGEGLKEVKIALWEGELLYDYGNSHSWVNTEYHGGEIMVEYLSNYALHWGIEFDVCVFNDIDPASGNLLDLWRIKNDSEVFTLSEI